MTKSRWIQKAIKKPGALEAYFQRKLGIPKKAKIPKRILEKIVKAKAGQTITVKYRNRRARIRVTRLLERRAALALTLRRLAKKKKRKRRRKRKRVSIWDLSSW